jgi:hypothetical protein
MDLIAYGAACLGLVWGWTMTPRGAFTRTKTAIKLVETLLLMLLVSSISGLSVSIIALTSTLFAVTTHSLWLKSLREGRMT